MTIGSSLILIAAGAILKWAVTAHVEGVNLQNMGVILMAIGALGLGLGLFVLLRVRWSADPRPDAE